MSFFDAPVPTARPARSAPATVAPTPHAAPAAPLNQTTSGPKKPFFSRDISPYSGMFDGAPGLHQGPNGVFRDSLRTAEGSLGRTSASGSLGIGETIGLHGQVGTQGRFGDAQAAGDIYATANANANGKVGIGLKGLNAEGHLGAQAGVGFNGHAEANTPSLHIKGVDPLNAGVAADADGFAGAAANADGKLGIGLHGINADGSLNAFAGAQASATANEHLGPLGAHQGVTGMAGIGFDASGHFDIGGGHLSIGGELGGALGLGGKFSQGIDINYGQIGQLGMAGLRGAGQLAGDGWEGAQGLASDGWNGTKDLAGAGWDGATNLASNGWDGAKSLAGGAGDLAGKGLDKAKDVGHSVVTLGGLLG